MRPARHLCRALGGKVDAEVLTSAEALQLVVDAEVELAVQIEDQYNHIVQRMAWRLVHRVK